MSAKARFRARGVGESLASRPPVGTPPSDLCGLRLADGRRDDLQALPLTERKAALARFGKMAECWIFVGEGRAHYPAVVEADLRASSSSVSPSPITRKLARWHKILNRTYSQHRGQTEWFRERRAGRYVGHWLKT
jgi:hypothetical protein